MDELLKDPEVAKSKRLKHLLGVAKYVWGNDPECPTKREYACLLEHVMAKNATIRRTEQHPQSLLSEIVRGATDWMISFAETRFCKKCEWEQKVENTKPVLKLPLTLSKIKSVETSLEQLLKTSVPRGDNAVSCPGCHAPNVHVRVNIERVDNNVTLILPRIDKVGRKNKIKYELDDCLVINNRGYYLAVVISLDSDRSTKGPYKTFARAKYEENS